MLVHRCHHISGNWYLICVGTSDDGRWNRARWQRHVRVPHVIRGACTTREPRRLHCLGRWRLWESLYRSTWTPCPSRLTCRCLYAEGSQFRFVLSLRSVRTCCCRRRCRRCVLCILSPFVHRSIPLLLLLLLMFIDHSNKFVEPRALPFLSVLKIWCLLLLVTLLLLLRVLAHISCLLTRLFRNLGRLGRFQVVLDLVVVPLHGENPVIQ